MCGIVKSVTVLFVNEKGNIVVSRTPEIDALVQKTSLSISPSLRSDAIREKVKSIKN